MSILSLSKTERRRVTVFFTCLFLAIITWLFFALSGNYVYQTNAKINYIDIPVNKAFNPLQSDTVKLRIQAAGWQLLFSKLRVNLPAVDISLKEISRQSFITLSDQLDRINLQIPPSQKAVAVSPDTLYFDFTSRSVKKVPVVLRYNLQFKKYWGIRAKPIIDPPYVVVTGPKESLEKITSWPTDSVKAKNVSSDIRKQVPLELSAEANIGVYPGSVNVTVPVDQFTEKIIEVPLDIINPSKYHIRIVPEKVVVKLLTSLRSYPGIKKKSVTAFVDVHEWEKYHYSHLPVRLSHESAFTRIISIEPQTVDFIIYK